MCSLSHQSLVASIQSPHLPAQGRTLLPGGEVPHNVLVLQLGEHTHLPLHLLPPLLSTGQPDPLHRVVDVVVLVLALKHHPEPSSSQTFLGLEVGEVPGPDLAKLLT